MLLIPTILVGSLFGYAFGTNLISAFLVGLISYFLLNIIPHWNPRNFENHYVVTIRYLDFAFGLTYFFFLFFAILQKGNSLTFAINNSLVLFDARHFFGALGALLLFLFYYFLKNKEIKNIIIKKIYDLGQMISYQDRSLWGIFVQIAITIVSITILFRLIDFPSWQKIMSQILN